MSRISMRLGDVELEIPDRHGKYTARTVDLFTFAHELLEAGRDAVLAGDHGKAAEQRAAYLALTDFGDVLPSVASAVLDRVWAEMEEVKKKGHLNGSAETRGRSASPSLS